MSINPSNWTPLDMQAKKEVEELNEGVVKNLILINVSTQILHFIREQELKDSYPISSAKNGTGQAKGTGKTPLGLHCVQEKIGDGADPFAVFKSRIPTGEIAAEKCNGDAIVGRILWLRGLQQGFNQGANVDTYARYIYIHGTNDTGNIGKAVSAGCIRMNPHDVIDLFDQVAEGTKVYIYV